MRWLTLVLTLAVLSAACEPQAVTRQRVESYASPTVIYVWDAFGDCYALVSGPNFDTRSQSWVQQKPVACRERQK